MEAVGAGGHNLVKPVLSHGFKVLVGHSFVDILIPKPSGGIAGAVLLGAQDGKIYPRRLHYGHHGPADLLITRIVGPGAPHPVQYVGLALFRHQW